MNNFKKAIYRDALRAQNPKLEDNEFGYLVAHIKHDIVGLCILEYVSGNEETKRLIPADDIKPLLMVNSKSYDNGSVVVFKYMAIVRYNGKRRICTLQDCTTFNSDNGKYSHRLYLKSN